MLGPHACAGLGIIILATVGASSIQAAASMSIISERSRYKGWNSHKLANEFVGIEVVPEIGGRVIQYRLGNRELFWVNPQLAGKIPPASGLGPRGEWLNYGGDKLWPAPQGWVNEDQWPGPPDAILDGSPHVLEIPEARPGEVAVRLTSKPDPRTGVQFSRTVRLQAGITRVVIDATMKNISHKPRRWGIWTVTQIDGARADGRGFNPEINAYCPINPKSRYVEGYQVLFGATNNPTFQTLGDRCLFQLKYQYQVGKVALDSHAGWSATVDGSDGAVFVQRFRWEPKKEYPDGASVEFWSSGLGKIHAYGQEMEMSKDPRETPYLIECELLSPFASLQPGEQYEWRYEWCASNLGGNYPVVDCNDEAVIAEPLRARIIENQVRVTTQLGVLREGWLRVCFLDKRQHLMPGKTRKKVTPFEGVGLDAKETLPPNAEEVALLLENDRGEVIAELARRKILRR